MSETKELSAAQLRETAQRLLEVADRLDEAELHSHPGSQRGIPDHGTTHEVKRRRLSVSTTELVTFAQCMYRQRMGRNEHFSAGFANEPAWDMMLDLFVLRHQGKQVTVSGACLASNGPATTALRYLQWLEEQDFIQKWASHTDKRVQMVELTDKGMGLMSSYLASCIQTFLSADSKSNAGPFMLSA